MEHRQKFSENAYETEYRTDTRIENLSFSGLDILGFLVASFMTLAPLAMAAIYTPALQV
jgi:hypothetical protein